MRRYLCLILVFFACHLPALAKPHLLLIGDSTMSDMPLNRPRRGWGMGLGRLFVDPSMVVNRAVNGASSMSYIADGHWAKALAEVQPGDFVLIEFGHNDALTDNPQRRTDPATTFPEYLSRYVHDVRAKGAFPILATPVSRRRFNTAGKVVPTHGGFPDATRFVARKESIPLLDLELLTTRWLESIGDEASKPYFMGRRNPRLPPGEEDDTHFVDAGADKVSDLAATEIRAQKLPLAQWLK